MNLGEEVAAQLLGAAAAARVAAGVLCCWRWFPACRNAVFHGRRAARRCGLCSRDRVPAAAVRRAPAPAAGRAETPPRSTRSSVEVGYALVTLVDEKQGGTLLTRVRAIRRQIATETGLVVPPVHIADNLQLGRGLHDPGQGRRGGARRAVCRTGCSPSTRARRPRRSTASQTREPAFGLPACGSPTSSATRRRPPATRSSIRRPRSRRTCPRRSARSCPTC